MSLYFPRKKLSCCAPQEGPEELQVGQDQTKPGSELGVLPSRVPAAPEGLQQEGAGKETKDLQGTQQNPETVEDQAPERSQVMSAENWAGRHGMTDPQGDEGPPPSPPFWCTVSAPLCALEMSSMQSVWVAGMFWRVLIVHSKPLGLVSRVALWYVSGCWGQGAGRWGSAYTYDWAMLGLTKLKQASLHEDILGAVSQP